MRDKWVLKHSLTTLRKNRGLSMEALAQLAYTTNTTIFRVEKTGVIADDTIAKKLATVFDIPFEDFCSKNFASERMEKEWENQLRRPYETQAKQDSSYYLVFVKRYEKHGDYTVISPTIWAGNKDGKEYRKLCSFAPDNIVEHLTEYSVRCAVVHDSLALVHFYYGIPDNEERAALIRIDIADNVYPKLVKEYFFDDVCLPDHYDFKDLVVPDLYGKS